MGIMRKAMAGDGSRILPLLRPEDIREVEAVTGSPPAPILMEHAIASSDRAWTLTDSGGRPAAILGTQPVFDQPSMGYVWMVGTDLLRSHRIEFLKGSRKNLLEVYGPYDLLTNYVDERNELHVSWLKWLGFSIIGRLEAYGAQGRPFLHFVGIKPI